MDTGTLENRVPRRILVPLDGSSFAGRALPHAVAIAKQTGAALQLVLVHETIVAAGVDSVMVSPELDSRVREHEREYLHGIERDLGERHGITVNWEIVDGPVVIALATQTLQPGVELVVMTTHGNGGLKRLWLGSVADELIRRSGIPVLLIRSAGEAGHDVEPKSFRHVLVTLDGSGLSESVIGPAVSIARSSGAHLTLLRVIDRVPPIIAGSGAGGMPPIVSPPVDFRAMEEEAAEYVREQGSRLALQGVRVRTKTMIGDRIAETILESARASHADLIAMATHGRSGLKRLILGSVADKVMRGAKVSVLLVSPSQDPSRPAREIAQISAASGLISGTTGV